MGLLAACRKEERGSRQDGNTGKRKLLRDELVQEVLRQVRGSLEHGLWIKLPRYPEKFALRGNSFALDLPMNRGASKAIPCQFRATARREDSRR